MGKEYQSPKQVIQSYLEERAKSDPLFVTSYTKPNKNIDECYDYIIGEAKKRGGSVVCMSDDEVFGLAVHYYDEDDIKVSKQPAIKAVVSNRPEKKRNLYHPLRSPNRSRLLIINVKERKRKYLPDNFYYLKTYETKNKVTA